jgi:hypothetical protein
VGATPNNNIILNKYTPQFKKEILTSYKVAQGLRASQGCSVCHPAHYKMDEEKSKCTGLAQENGFGLA